MPLYLLYAVLMRMGVVQESRRVWSNPSLASFDPLAPVRRSMSSFELYLRTEKETWYQCTCISRSKTLRRPSTHHESVGHPIAIRLLSTVVKLFYGNEWLLRGQPNAYMQ